MKMELNEKSFARQKFRSSRGRGRGGRSGRGGHHRSQNQRSSGPDLDSNAFRYEDNAEQAEDGVIAPKSQGADLEALLEDADTQFNQAFYRFRAQLQDITDEVPPLGATQPQQLLAIDLQQLGASLAALPLHALLGLEPCYLEGLDTDSRQQTQQPQQEQQQWLQGSQLHSADVRVKLPAPAPAPAPAASAAAAAAAQGVDLVASTSAVSFSLVPVPVLVRTAEAWTQPPPVASHGPGSGDDVSTGDGGDDVDRELEALLTGRPARPTASVQPALLPGPGPGGLSEGPGPGLPPAMAAALAAAPLQASMISPLVMPSPPVGASLPSTGAQVIYGGTRAFANLAGPTALSAASISGAGDGNVLPVPGSVAGYGNVLPPFGARVGGGNVLPAPSTLLIGQQPEQKVACLGQVTVIARNAAVIEPARLGAQTRGLPATAASAAVRGSPVSGVAAAGGGLDEELRMLLGLPGGGGTPAASAAAAATAGARPGQATAAARAPTVAPSQGLLKPGTRVGLAAAPEPPRTGPSQPAAAKSLDDWLEGL